MSNDQVHHYLTEALKYYKHKELAEVLGVNAGTIRRWELKETEPRPYLTESLKQLLLPWGEQVRTGDFRFIDLFAGIGGLRLAFESIGGECVFTSEWDSYAQKTYRHNFPSNAHSLAGDITKISEFDIPDHDVLLAGFPCQPFSIAGVSKKNSLGRAHGFSDETQGTLFFDVARIIKSKQPKAFVLENVKNLQSHDKGRTFDVIRKVLTEELGYQLHVRVVDGQHFVPQHRERIVMVGFREPTPFTWDALQLPTKGIKRMKDILHRTDGSEPFLEWDANRFFNHQAQVVNDKYALSDKLWAYLQGYAEKHRAKGNGFGFGLVNENSVSRTLSARYYKDGSEILVDRGWGVNPRRLTPRECARLMGYPDDFRIPVSDTRAYQQFGNSVVMLAFKEVARILQPYVVDHLDSVVQPDLLSNAS